MRIRSHLVVLAAVVLATSAAAAGEHEVRAGVVTAMQPIKEQGEAISTSTRRQLGGMLGRALGQAVGGGSGQSYEITRAVGNLGADIAAGDERAAPTGNYMLMVRFDDASESAFTRSGEQLGRIRAGSRVKVVGSGAGAMLMAE